MTPVAVRSRSVPFDADAGPAADGRPSVAYSRCAAEPTQAPTGPALAPDWSTARGCHLYVADLAGGGERRLRPVERAGDVPGGERGARGTTGATVVGTDLSAAALAFLWQTSYPGLVTDGTGWELHTLSLGRRSPSPGRRAPRRPLAEECLTPGACRLMRTTGLRSTASASLGG